MSSASATAAAGSSTSPAVNLRAVVHACMARAVSETDEAQMMELACVFMHFVRGALLQLAPLARAAAAASTGASGATTDATLSCAQLQKVFDSSTMQQQVESALGASAGADACAKAGSCGPFLAALLTELKTRCSASGIVRLTDVLAALASPALQRWYALYAEGQRSNHCNATLPGGLKLGLMRDLISATFALTLTAWTASGSACSSLNSVSLRSTVNDFRALVYPTNSPLFLALFDRLHPCVKKIGSVGHGHSTRVTREIEHATRHCNALHTFEAWAESIGAGRGDLKAAASSSSAAAPAASASAAPSTSTAPLLPPPLPVARRPNAQRKPGLWTTLKSSKLKHMRTLDDGTVLFRDEIAKANVAATRAEKKRRQAEEAEAKRLRQAEAAAAASQKAKSKQESRTPAAVSAATGAASKPMFEVVVPFTPVQRPSPKLTAAPTPAPAPAPAPVPAPKAPSPSAVPLPPSPTETPPAEAISAAAPAEVKPLSDASALTPTPAIKQPEPVTAKQPPLSGAGERIKKGILSRREARARAEAKEAEAALLRAREAEVAARVAAAVQQQTQQLRQACADVPSDEDGELGCDELARTTGDDRADLDTSTASTGADDSGPPSSSPSPLSDELAQWRFSSGGESAHTSASSSSASSPKVHPLTIMSPCFDAELSCPLGKMPLPIGASPLRAMQMAAAPLPRAPIAISSGPLPGIPSLSSLWQSQQRVQLRPAGGSASPFAPLPNQLVTAALHSPASTVSTTSALDSSALAGPPLVGNIALSADSAPSAVLLLHGAPAYLLSAALSAVAPFAAFVPAPLSVRYVLTGAHGLTAVLTYADSSAACQAQQSMRRSSMHLRVQTDDDADAGAVEWSLPPAVFAADPLHLLPMPHVSVSVSASSETVHSNTNEVPPPSTLSPASLVHSADSSRARAEPKQLAEDADRADGVNARVIPEADNASHSMFAFN